MEKYIILQGFYDCYAVSNMGNVMNIRDGHVLQPSIRSDGYKSILLSKNGKKTSIRVHRLVAEYFLDKVEGKTYINHKNGVKYDNRVENLVWCTAKENKAHALKMGLETHKYDNKDILVYDAKDGELLFSFESVKQCANMLGLNKSPIYRVLNGRMGKHHNYTFKYADRI